MEDAPSPPSRPWSVWQCLAFRFVLLFYLLYAFPRPFSLVLETGTELGHVLGIDVATWPWLLPAWIGETIDLGWQELTSWMYGSGLAPYEVIHQLTGSGDTAHDIARLIAIVALASAGTMAWTAVAKTRPDAASRRGYPRLGRWLHLAVRFDLAFWMVGYGAHKFYGGQFGDLGLMRLTQEIGDTTPMGMVGTFMQASRPYELFCGGGEVLGGLLLFSRHTALLGACVTVAVMLNVGALNWLCGVPVKLFSTYLLLCAIGLMAPWAERLCALFVRNRPSAPVDMRLPVSAKVSRWLLGFGWTWIVVALVTNHFQGIAPKPWRQGRERSALYGLWRVETMLLDGVEVPASDASRWRDFAVDAGNMAWAREYSGKFHLFQFQWDEAKGQAQVKPSGADDAVTAVAWQVGCGTKMAKGYVPLLLRREDYGRMVDGERRTLVLTGTWGGKQLELRTVEKQFRLQTGFRLRQELPEGW